MHTILVFTWSSFVFTASLQILIAYSFFFKLTVQEWHQRFLSLRVTQAQPLRLLSRILYPQRTGRHGDYNVKDHFSENSINKGKYPSIKGLGCHRHLNTGKHEGTGGSPMIAINLTNFISICMHT